MLTRGSDEFAQLAGLGWIGKNTLLLNRSAGSWFFLAALLTDVELEYDVPHETDHCGTCTACLDACPTQAFVAPYVLDSRRCISYLTIELRTNVPAELRAGVGDWVFGCDVCQEVCPYNRAARPMEDPDFLPRVGIGPKPALIPLMGLDASAFKERFRGSPILRPKRRGFLRNVAVALGNAKDPVAVPVLARALEDEEPLVRSHSAWALGEIGGNDARAALDRARLKESDEGVLGEISAAIAR